MRTYNERVKYKGYEFEVDYTKEDCIYIEAVGLIYEDWDDERSTPFKNWTEDIMNILSNDVVDFIFKRLEAIELEKDEEYLDDDR